MTTKMAGSIKIRENRVLFKETGSPFDATPVDRILQKAGGHDTLPSKAIDVSAFSHSKRTNKPVPQEFLKRGTGSGGMMPKSLQANGPVSPKKKKVNSVVKKTKMVDYQAFAQRPNPPNTQLRRFYERGDLPVQVDHGGVHNRIAWKVDIQKLDFHHYLPIFFDGLRETEAPYSFLAEQGVYDMLSAGSNKVLPVIPQLIIPVKTALNTRDRHVIVKVWVPTSPHSPILHHCPLTSSYLGQALVPYYRQILPVLNIFIRKNDNLGDNIDYAQQKRANLGELIMETLEAFEVNGGEDAFINIKYLCPIYQSVIIS
ncbi:unnamed protein product [Chrysoparadoxa australica]